MCAMIFKNLINIVMTYNYITLEICNKIIAVPSNKGRNFFSEVSTRDLLVQIQFLNYNRIEMTQQSPCCLPNLFTFGSLILSHTTQLLMLLLSTIHQYGCIKRANSP